MERIPSGNPQLDLVLGGGFTSSSIHVVMGAPGTGKTILAEQLAFANATRTRPALYLTTVSEPLQKFLLYLQEYTFADVTRVGAEIFYTSIAPTLSEQPRQLTALVTELVKQHRPSILVIDSFKAIADLMPDLTTWRRQLHDLAGFLSAYRMTSFWIGEYATDTTARLPEFAIADGILELTREQEGGRDFRFLRVVKQRGSAFLNGNHAFFITNDGLEVFPRLQGPKVETVYHPKDERLSSGTVGLDEMIATGWLRGSTTVLTGPSGAGKTALGLQFLREGVRSGESSLLLTLEENPTQVARVIEHFGWNTSDLLGLGKLDVFFCSPVELQIDTIVREFFRRIDEHDVRRVVIDGVGDLAYTTADARRFRDYLFALTQHFATRNVTAMLTVSNERTFSWEEIYYLGDNLLLLEMHLGEQLVRTIRVLKTRGSAHDGLRHPVSIGAGGVVVK